MNYEEYSAWLEANAVTKQRYWFNGIEYEFAEMEDGWIAVFEVDRGRYFPVIQAADLPHAESYCAMIEPATVPMEVIA